MPVRIPALQKPFPEPLCDDPVLHFRQSFCVTQQIPVDHILDGHISIKKPADDIVHDYTLDASSSVILHLPSPAFLFPLAKQIQVVRLRIPIKLYIVSQINSILEP